MLLSSYQPSNTIPRPLVAICFVMLISSAAVGQGSVLIVGGGSEPGGSLAWFVEQVANNKVVVLDYTNDPGIGITNRLAAQGADVTYLPVTSSAAANDPVVIEAVLAADGIFLPGGNQWLYVQRWRGTALQDAIHEVWDRGGAIGGTSAGAMALSQVVFDARYGSIDSRQGLLTPTAQSVSLTDNFIGVVPGTLVDTHFHERGRLGRLLGMLARYHADTGTWVNGIGLDVSTALAISSDGTALTMGGGAVTLLYPHEGTVASVAAGETLELRNMRFVQVVAGHRVNLATGEILEEPSDASAFEAHAFSSPVGTVMMDGGMLTSHWMGNDGSIAAFAALTGEEDVTCLVSLPDADVVETVTEAFAASGIALQHIGLNNSTKDDPDLAAAAAQCDALVWAGNNIASVPVWAAPSTAVGGALHNRIDAGAPNLMLGTDARVAGSEFVFGTELRCDAAFLGLLSTLPGLGLYDGLITMPNGFGTPTCTWENTASGFIWGVAQRQSPFGVLIPYSGRVVMEGPVARVEGHLPALFLDSRAATRRAFPILRHNAALDRATIHVIRSGSWLDLAAAVSTEPSPGVQSASSPFITLAAAFPNPARDRLAVSLMTAAPAEVQWTVTDILGRIVLQGRVDARGPVDLEIDTSGLPAGTYVLRLASGGDAATRILTVVR